MFNTNSFLNIIYGKGEKSLRTWQRSVVARSRSHTHSFCCPFPVSLKLHWAQQVSGDPLYYNYIKRYVDQQVDEQRNIAGFKSDALDNFLPGYAILFMYEQTHLTKYKIAAGKIRAAFDTYPRNANGMFWLGSWAKNQTWVDGLFIGQIFLAFYGKTIGDSEYAFNEVVKQITIVAQVFQKNNGLLLHGWDESKKASGADKKQDWHLKSGVKA